MRTRRHWNKVTTKGSTNLFYSLLDKSNGLAGWQRCPSPPVCSRTDSVASAASKRNHWIPKTQTIFWVKERRHGIRLLWRQRIDSTGTPNPTGTDNTCEDHLVMRMFCWITRVARIRTVCFYHTHARFLKCKSLRICRKCGDKLSATFHFKPTEIYFLSARHERSSMRSALSAITIVYVCVNLDSNRGGGG